MKNKIFYFSVCFSPYTKSYYYRSFDEDIGVGDLVVVPVGDYDQEQMGIVRKVEAFAFHEVPYPLPKTKTVIRKEDINDYPDLILYRDMIINYDEDYEKGLSEEEPVENTDFLKSKFLLLCDIGIGDTKKKVWAEIHDGCLLISGQDLKPVIDDAWDDSKDEYFFKLDFTNTELIFHILSSKYGEVTKGLLEEFRGEDGCKKFRVFCEKHKIHFNFFSYV